MLVLSRKNGQKLVIDDNIVITIIECGQNLVKIGIEAPKSVKIFREEIYLEIKKANQDSEKINTDDLLSLTRFMPKTDVAQTKISIKKNDKQ